MKTNSHKKKYGKSISIIEEKLKRIPIKKLSKQSGFCKRKPRKVKPKELLVAFIQIMCGLKKNTYSNWANQLGILIKATVSKQAISKRMNEALVIFLQSVLKEIMEESLKTRTKEKVCEKLKQFKRILIEDSTSIKLNNRLSKEYPGNKNYNGKTYAVLKIQSMYDILKRRFIRFEITSFRKNDQGYSSKILEIAKRGDLVIRDLGYFVLKVFKRLSEGGIYFISRLRKEVNVHAKSEGKEEKPIDLASILKKRGSLDIEAFIGERDKLPARLVAIPADKNIAERRRRKARKNRDRRLNPSRKHLFLLGWDIFITNIEKEKLDSNLIAMLYGIRWRIEIIYKSWKSYLGITNVPNDANKIRLEAFIYCMLIFILIFQVYFYEYYLKNQKGENIQRISLLKLMQFLLNNISFIIYLDYFNKKLSMKKLLDKQILYFCTYEHRKDRMNYNQLIQKLS